VVPSPVDPGSRPLLARVRQSLCDSLQAEIEGAGVLDLFAGSGVVGIEMLSRGAAALTALDSSPRAVERIDGALREFGVAPERGKAVRGDALRPARWLRPDLPGSPFSLVFVGTPYRLSDTLEGRQRLAGALAELGPRLAGEALVVVQFEPGQGTESPGEGWTEEADRQRISGRTGLAFWRAPAQPS
jgi:16S rRNA (guanine966-N2)-methyltransferase